MAAFHVRSISLPSRSHPLTVSVEEQLCKLKASQSLSVGQKLSGLKYLFEFVDDLLQLPLSHQILSRANQNQCVEGALNGSLQLLDICNTARELFSQMKENEKQLQSSLRRRKGDSSLTAEGEAYMVSRKKLSKVISKSLRNLRRKDRKCSLENNSELNNMMSMLSQVEDVSIEVFESILSSISQPMPKSKASGWSLVSKLLQSKDRSCEGEMEKIEKHLLVILSSKEQMKLEQVRNVVKGLKAMESSFQEVEEELESVYRQLVKTRVSLLNILNN